jgi:hypothetical protein
MRLQLFLSVSAVALIGSFFTDIREAPASGTAQGSSVHARQTRSLSSSMGGSKWARERRSQGDRAAAAASPSFVAAASASAAGRPVKAIQAMP